ncbi:ectonucleotide pyrophosphatase/phosphodiesterase family member 3-like isoform X2 [Lineus longissimus]|uniref:ectonucleotide pyrophosphatase/phosphodiesterase family member 3-like isoform X2 n=1 Tax=Lineus longissimus TaxID=88925 RepID=UPI00315DA4B7
MISSSPEYGTMSSPVTGSTIELVIKDKKPCLKPWMKVLIGLGLLAFICFALGIGIYYSINMWSGIGEWVHTPCATTDDIQSCPGSYAKTPITLLISCDGFLASYLLKNVTPTFKRFQKCGVSAPYMRPVYPSKTFPNHYSIATGLFPAWNGITGNIMFDKKLGKVFRLSTSEKFNPEWYQGEPIWNTVTKHNKTSASYFWVGSDVPVEGMYPKYYKNFTSGIPFEEEVDEVLKWIDMPEDKRPNFITMYFNEPDSAGHRYGPDSPEVKKQIEYVDSIIGMMMNGLVDREIHNCVNVIVVADHGMAETSCDRVVLVKDYVNLTNMYVYSGTFGRINTEYFIESTTVSPFPEPHRNQDELVNSLRCANDHLQTQFKWDLPKRFHYAHNDRIEDIVMNVDDGWLVGRTKPKDACSSKGNHGYDDDYKSMEALFVAHGPSFKINYTVEPFLNIELYNLLTELVNITGVPNNGTMGSLHHMLTNPSTLPQRDQGHAYENCSFPSDPTEYSKRAAAQTSCTNCALPPGVTVKTIDEQLNINTAEANDIIALHIPSGEPLLQGLGTVCTLVQQDYVHGYSEVFHSPIWSAYQLAKSTEAKNMTSEPCLRPDVRLPVGAEANCSDFKAASSAQNITSGFLHPPEFSTNETRKLDSHILSNAVPMYEGFRSGIWQDLLNMLGKWQSKHGSLSVISGPAYDYDYDGHYDDLTKIKRFMNDGAVPVPTHYYTIITKPRDKSESTYRKNDVMAFLLPHKSEPTTCQAQDVYLFLHAARVKDVELLTGLEFFPKYDRYESLALQTYLMDDLWSYDV